jgi:hypothetical protein
MDVRTSYPFHKNLLAISPTNLGMIIHHHGLSEIYLT